MATHEVVVIGAGPFGLSLSAWLDAVHVEHAVIGKRMDTWRNHCPAGMMLRSEPYGSSIASPLPGMTVRDFCDQAGRPYVDRLGPLPLTDFLDYADWYADRLVPDVIDLTVTGLERTASGFRVTTAEGEQLAARGVAIAAGVMPFAQLPEQLDGLPAELVSSAGDHGDLRRFGGQRVFVVGGGQSASETAALLHEAGADASLVVRGSGVHWLAPNPADVSGLRRLTRPVNNLCEGWHCAFWNTPSAFRRLPQEMRSRKARSVLGPAGAWWLRDRVEGKLPILTHTTVVSARPVSNHLRVVVRGPDGEREEFVDHLIAATGYRVDVNRLPWLEPGMARGLDQHAGYPQLRRTGESSMPGLFFLGALAAGSLGPSTRFIAGTHTSVRQAAHALARRTGRSAAVPVPAQRRDQERVVDVSAGHAPTLLEKG